MKAKRLLIVSTCGTSVLTNLATQQNDAALRGLVIQNANRVDEKDIGSTDRARLADLAEQTRKRLLVADSDERARLSAELNGLTLLQRERDYAGASPLHWLIATDTWLGQQTAECLQQVLEQAGHQVEIKSIRGLRTDDRDAFRNAVVELTRLCAQELKGMRDSGYRVVFNLTGGFKAVQGFMQALGMLYADDIVYVFERTDSLLHIPRLPVALDALEIVRRHQKVFRKFAAGMQPAADELSEMPDTLYEQVDDIVDLSVWGHALWEDAKVRLFEQKLWEPVTNKMKFGRQFEKSVLNVCNNQKDRLRLVNERLLQLARHLEEPGYNPPSLDFKQLKGRHDPWTHECDAWSDRDARRIFGHFENDVFILDELGKHL